MPIHLTFSAKGASCYNTTETVSFSLVKITCYFHVWRYRVFAKKLTYMVFHSCLFNKYINLLEKYF